MRSLEPAPAPVRRTGMRILGFLAICLTAFAAQLSSAPNATACSCIGIGDQEAFDAADAVFVGTVESVPTAPNTRRWSSDDPGVWSFSVESVYKGAVVDQQSVVSAIDGSSCGLELADAERVVVFARNEPHPFERALDGAPLYADLCGGSRSLMQGAVPTSFGAPTPPIPGVSAVLRSEAAPLAPASNERGVIPYLAFAVLILGAVAVASVVVKRGGPGRT